MTLREEIIYCLIRLEYLQDNILLPTRKPTHGTCCTCQECGQPQDECVCNHNELLSEINGIFESQPLYSEEEIREAWKNLTFNDKYDIKGYEYFDIDFIQLLNQLKQNREESK